MSRPLPPIPYCSCGVEVINNYGTEDRPLCYTCWKYEHIVGYDERDEEDEE